MKNRILAAFSGILMIAIVVMAQQNPFYLKCNHQSHDDGNFAQVGGPFDTIAECNEARATHRNNHGEESKGLNVQCFRQNKERRKP